MNKKEENKNEVKSFNIIRADAILDNSKLRDEKIGNIFNENVRREYKFTMNPTLISEQPMILVMPDTKLDDYWRTLIESVVTLNDATADIITEDAPGDSMDSTLRDSICDMSKVMNTIIHSDSWRDNNLSDEDKKIFNDLIEKLKID